MENIGFEIAETARLVRREFNRRVAVLGATGAQWRVLARLALEDGQRQVDLADALDLEPITLCRMLDRLEEAGLVERRRDPADRRAWRIHLSAAAAPVIDELAQVGQAFNGDLLRGVSAAEQEMLRDVLARMRANIASAAPQELVS